ncbi:MAG: type II secretion system F family protein [Pirellulaceae bacterium]
MSLPATLVSRPITLDQLVALSDEIAALARAGVPLDRGLRELSRDLPGRLGRLAGDLSKRLAAGESLAQIVAGSKGMFPPAYQAVLEAGLRVGRLPAAMEETARTARRIRDLRSSIGIALLYPLIVIQLAWQFFIFGVLRTGPVLLGVLEEMQPGFLEWLPTLIWLAEWALPWTGLLLACWLAALWYRTGRIAAGVELHPLLAWGTVGLVARMQRAARLAALTDLLALLVSHRVPLDEAVELASAAVGSPRMAAGGRDLAERIRRGQFGGPPPHGFSPLLAWTLTCGGGHAHLSQTLHRTSQIYRDEFQRRAQWLGLYVPLFATVVVAGGVVILYAIFSLAPWILIMHRLSDPLLQ